MFFECYSSLSCGDHKAVHQEKEQEKRKKGKSLELLFEYLNLMELMGAIYEMRAQGLIEEELLKKLFGQELETYILFYEIYLTEKVSYKFDESHQGKCCAENKSCDHPPAIKLLTYFKYKRSKKGGDE